MSDKTPIDRSIDVELCFLTLKFRSLNMSKTTANKQCLLHPIENHRHTFQSSNATAMNNASTQHSVAVNTEQSRSNHDISTNTPNYAEEMARAMQNGNGMDEVVQMLMQGTAIE
jgi:hypothetical protein